MSKIVKIKILHKIGRKIKTRNLNHKILHVPTQKHIYIIYVQKKLHRKMSSKSHYKTNLN